MPYIFTYIGNENFFGQYVKYSPDSSILAVSGLNIKKLDVLYFYQ